MRQPSLRAIGANHCSRARRNPASAPTRLTSTISPPGFNMRAHSSSVASGLGTVVITYWATTTSNEASGNDRCSASITQSPSTLERPSSATRSCALRNIGSEISMPQMRLLRE